MYINIYIYTWNPNDPYFDWKRPSFGGLTFKNRAQQGVLRYIERFFNNHQLLPSDPFDSPNGGRPKPLKRSLKNHQKGHSEEVRQSTTLSFSEVWFRVRGQHHGWRWRSDFKWESGIHITFQWILAQKQNATNELLFRLFLIILIFVPCCTWFKMPDF